MIRRVLLALALLCLWGSAHARPVVWGGVPCTQDGTDTDGCYNGGSWQVPGFFQGYANQSVGVSFPRGNYQTTTYAAATSLQPATYPNRPPWNVAGVDYAVGMPRWQMPTLSNLHPAWLKDPAQIATDRLVNPNGLGENCKFYTSNAAYTGGVMPGTNVAPSPSGFSGPFIYCSNTTPSGVPLVFDGYNFGWNSSTGWNCVQIIIKQNNWGKNAGNTGPDDANIVFRNNLFLNGPGCNIWGGLYQGSGTAAAGPMSPNSTYQLLLSAGSPFVPNSFSFHHNTVLGCGGDANATALETALCSQTFNATSYAAGSISTFINGATVGVAPVDNGPLHLSSVSTYWIEYNAFVHIPGRIAANTSNQTTHSEYIDHNYIEGIVYYKTQWAQIASIACTANCASPSSSSPTTELVTTVAPHNIPVGSWVSFVMSTAGPWAGGPTWSMQATDATHLTFNSITNPGDYTYVSGAYPTLLAEAEHGEVIEWGLNTTSAASYNGTISGNTLTVNSLTSGALAVGQYVTAGTGTDAVITGSISGNVLTVSSVTSGALAVGQVITGTGIPAGTVIATGSGSSWTLSQAPINAVGSETINAYISIPTGTYITSGSGSTWTLSQSLANPATGPMVNPAYAGQTVSTYISYNTVLWTASQADTGETSWYESCGLGNNGVPICVFGGSIDHNVAVVNLIPNGTSFRRGASVAFVNLDYSSYGTLAISKNYYDPTGSYTCMGSQQSDFANSVTISGNVNLLSASDPYANTLQSYSIVPYNNGTSSNSQAESGVSYNSSTGVVTVTTALPVPGIGAGSQVQITNVSVSQGTNYLNGFKTVTGAFGNTFTFNAGAGYPGIMSSVSPVAALASGGNPLTCYGHN